MQSGSINTYAEGTFIYYTSIPRLRRCARVCRSSRAVRAERTAYRMLYDDDGRGALLRYHQTGRRQPSTAPMIMGRLGHHRLVVGRDSGPLLERLARGCI
jgi:hypothetical protein